RSLARNQQKNDGCEHENTKQSISYLHKDLHKEPFLSSEQSFPDNSVKDFRRWLRLLVGRPIKHGGGLS
ncbi:MAG: hypothetical protein WAV70_13425, partial [Anaerolineae bacterium]